MSPAWRPLSSLARALRERARRLSLPAEVPLRERAAAVALVEHGEATFAAAPELTNVAALSLSLEQLVVHVLQPEVMDLVDGTDLHQLPDAPPRLLRRGWIVEVPHPERGERLFADVACLGGYALNGKVFLVGLGYPEGARVGVWTPRWTGEDLDGTVSEDRSPLLGDVAAHQAWMREAARFAVVLGLLLDAEGVPVQITDESSRAKAPPIRSKKTKPPPAWVTRYVAIAPETARGEPAGPTDVGAPPTEIGATAATAGRQAGLVGVRGHLKRQPYGPGGKLRKWVWIDSHEARRWLAPGPRKVIVGV
jgi:hypothetical protein